MYILQNLSIGQQIDSNRVSFDDAKTLKQKADLANKLCLGGTFAWAIDLGGPGTLYRPDQLNGTGLDGLTGSDLDGENSGSGKVYISPEIYKGKNPVVGCVPPCTLIMPPYSLSGETSTFKFPPYKTSLQYAWPTATTVVTPEGGNVTTSTLWDRTIQTTTLTIPPGKYWNMTTSNNARTVLKLF